MYVRRFMDSSNVPGTRIATMNRSDLFPLRYLGRLVRGWRIGPGETKPIWNLVLGAFLGFGVWDLELPPRDSTLDYLVNRG
jgi:hypothetical protein